MFADCECVLAGHPYQRCEHNSHRYNTRDEFAADMRRVFVNCELFNEDDSSVGRAGHVMYEFFEKRWTELTSGDTNDTT